MDKRSFVRYVKMNCAQHGIKCRLLKADHIKVNGYNCIGQFSPDQKILEVGMKNPIAYETLLHEFSHLLQWIHRSKKWVRYYACDGDLDTWLDGGRVANIDEVINRTKDMELEAEIISYGLIVSLNLRFIDEDYYAKQSNLHIQFYNWVRKRRRWSSGGRSLYRNAEALSLVPDSFSMDYTKIPTRLLDVIDRVFGG